jgi:hypothetical protein
VGEARQTRISHSGKDNIVKGHQACSTHGKFRVVTFESNCRYFPAWSTKISSSVLNPCDLASEISLSTTDFSSTGVRDKIHR